MALKIEIGALHDAGDDGRRFASGAHFTAAIAGSEKFIAYPAVTTTKFRRASSARIDLLESHGRPKLWN